MATSIITTTKVVLDLTTHHTNMEHGNRYFIFINDGTKTEGPELYGNLIASAQKKIIVWDPYLYHLDMELMKHIRYPISLIILTSGSAQKWNQKRDSLINELKRHVSSSLKSDVSVQIGYIDTDTHGTSKWNCHDRFLMIDDSEYFLIGSSMAHHRSLLSSTGILHVEHSEDKELINKAFYKVYNEAMSKRWISYYENLN